MTTSYWLDINQRKYTRKEILNQYDRFLLETGNKCSYKSFKKRVSEYYGISNKVKKQEQINEGPSIQEEQSDGIYKALISSTSIKTPEELIDYLHIDTTKWKLSKFIRNSWGSEESPNFQLKGEFTIQNRISEDEILEIIKEKVETFKPLKISINNHKEYKSDNMLEIALEDQHFGQFSVKEETGVDCDLETSRKNYLEGVSYMLEMSKGFNPEKIVFLVGSDFFNVDTTINTTYGGTPQAEASRWKHTFIEGLETVITAIEMCYNYCPKVDVKVIQGNHDYTRSFYLGIAIKQRFSEILSINVDVSEEPRKYESWGKNLICFTHGDKESFTKFPFIVAKEQQELFSKSKFVEVHCGHLHKEKESVVYADENQVFKTRVLPSLVTVDDWHKSKGFFHTMESQGFIWNKNNGNVAIIKYHI